jgi:hypothetical protein
MAQHEDKSLMAAPQHEDKSLMAAPQHEKHLKMPFL